MDDPEKFNLYIGGILAKLYGSLGTRVSLTKDDVEALIVVDSATGDSDAERARLAEAAWWLEKEGYIRAARGGRGLSGTRLPLDMVLTGTGLAALNATPKALGGKSIGKSLSEEAGKTAGAATIQSLVTMALQGGVRAISG